jgi:hypothetical protein
MRDMGGSPCIDERARQFFVSAETPGLVPQGIAELLQFM